MPISLIKETIYTRDQENKFPCPFYTSLSVLTKTKREWASGNCLSPVVHLSCSNKVSWVAYKQQKSFSSASQFRPGATVVRFWWRPQGCGRRPLAVSSQGRRSREPCGASWNKGTDPIPKSSTIMTLSPHKGPAPGTIISEGRIQTYESEGRGEAGGHKYSDNGRNLLNTRVLSRHFKPRLQSQK